MIRGQYADTEERIARVTDSSRKTDDLLTALNNPKAKRETRIEVAAWIAACKFNCRIFGGFARDWIVGGYSSKPDISTNRLEWISYKSERTTITDVQQVPCINKQFVPNGVDCYLPDVGFDIDDFLECLKGFGIHCGCRSKIWRGYVLLLDEDHIPFTMDLVSAESTLKFHKYRRLDIDVNNLYIEKDYRRALGARTDPKSNVSKQLGDLETMSEASKPSDSKWCEPIILRIV